MFHCGNENAWYVALCGYVLWLFPISYCAVFDSCGLCDLKWATETHLHTRLSHKFQLSSSSVCLSFCPSPGYQISYRLDSRDPQRWTTVEVGSNARQFTVTGLSPEQTYVFRLTARTAVGWGEEQEALVVTTERRGKGHTHTHTWYLVYYHICFCSNADVNYSR